MDAVSMERKACVWFTGQLAGRRLGHASDDLLKTNRLHGIMYPKKKGGIQYET
jgi:hypothetical protein